MSENGRRARDVLLGLMKTRMKLGVSFFTYPGDRLGRALLQGSERRCDTAGPRHFSCNAFELGTSEFSHPVENADADIRFCLLVFEVTRLQFRANHGLPSAHLGLHAAALIIAGGFLSGQPTTGLYPGDVAIANRCVQHRLAAGNGVLWRRDNDLHDFAKACCQQMTGWRAVIGAIGHKFGNSAVDLVQQDGQSRGIADVIRCEISADNLARGEVKTKVQLAPSFAFGLGVMLFLEPLALAEDLQARTVDHQMDRLSAAGSALCWQSQPFAAPRQGGEVRHRNLKTHQLSHTAQQALRLAQRLLVDNAQGQAQRNRQIRIFLLAVTRSRKSPPPESVITI